MWLHNVRWLFVLLVSFIIAQLATPLAIQAAWYFKILDYPNERKIHLSPIPRMGGIAVVIAILLSTLRNFQFSSELTGLVIGSSVIYLIGFVDDIHPLPATPRLIGQILACIIVVKSGVVVTFIPPGFFLSETIEAAITIFWLLGIANAVNFLDGVDGLATGLVAVCAMLFFFIAWPAQSYLSFLTIAVFGACLGFLPYNIKPAKTFMGDAGATFLGFLIAGLAVMDSWAYENPIVAFSTPLLILGIPIFDMIYTTISRVRNGSVKSFKQWLEYTGKDHFHHRLLKLGLSVPKSVGFIILLNICLGLGALIIRETGARGSLILLFQALVIFLIVVILMLSGRTLTED